MERPILITGASGFLGTALVRAVERQGWPVLGVSRTPQRQRTDLRWITWEQAQDSMAECRAVFHVATAYGRAESPEQIQEANVTRPLALAQAARRHGIPFLAADTFFRLTPSYAHLEAYTGSKRDFHRRMTALATDGPAHPFLVIHHMIGPGDDPRKGIPGLVRAIVQGHGRLPLTDGNQCRDFIHVDDVAEAFLIALKGLSSLSRGVVDLPVGSGVATSLRELLERAHRLAGSATVLGFGDLAQRPGEPNLPPADTTGLRALGWLPRRTLDEALVAMIDEVRHAAA